MTKQQLTHTIPLEKHEEQLKQLLDKTQHYSRKLIKNNYWNEETLEEYLEWRENTTAPSYKYFTSQKYNPFENTEEYTYNRYQRCVFEKIGRVIESHLEEYKAFKLVKNTISKEKQIKRVEKKKIKQEVFSKNTDYIPYNIIENLTKQLNKHYEKHEELPEKYTELISTPKPNGTLPLSPDDNHIHKLKHEENQIHFNIKTSDTINPNSYHDYSEKHFHLETYPKLAEQLKQSQLGKPTIYREDNTYYLDIPIKTNTLNTNTIEGRVLSLDLGVKTMVTSTIVQENQENHLELLKPPEFHNHPSQDKLYRLMNQSENQQGKQKHYTNEKEKRLREQIQHDIANQIVLKAHAHDCKTIVLEDLADLEAPKHQSNSKKISSWARGKLKQLIKYKANLMGLKVELENPWGTSQYCPKCGKRGEIVKSSEDHSCCESGGWFYCSSCGFEGDRDYTGALNVARVFFQEDDRIVLAKPVEYTSIGNHASFPKSSLDYRFTSVQPSTSESLPPLTVFRGEDNWYWLKNNSGRSKEKLHTSVSRLATTKNH